MTEKAERTIEKQWLKKAINFGLVAIFAFLFFFFSPSPVEAGNQQITFQGKLTNSSGNSVSNGTYYVKLTIWDAASGGSCQYTASSTCASVTSTPVTVTNGIFSINLGDTSASLAAISSTLFNSSALYLGITVCSGAGVGCDSEMTPRKRITAAPYAFNADYLSGLATSTIGGQSSYVPVTDSSGNLKISNSVFIATTTAGQFGVGTSTVPTGVKSYVEGTTATDKLLVLRGNSSQSGALQEWQNSAGTALASIDSSGNVSTSGTLSILQDASSNTASILHLINYDSSNTDKTLDFVLPGGSTAGTIQGLSAANRISIKAGSGNSLVIGAGQSTVDALAFSLNNVPVLVFDGVGDRAIFKSISAVLGDGSTTTTLTKNSLTLGQTSTVGAGKFYVDSSGNTSVSGSLITFGNVTSTGNLYALSGTASTSIINGSSLTLGQGTGYNSGMFNVNSNGNVNASGTITTASSLVASIISTVGLIVTGNIGVQGNSLLGNSDDAGGDWTQIYGTLGIGIIPTGNAQLYLKASSTTAVPMIIQGSTGGSATTYDYLTMWQDSPGNTIASMSTSTQTVIFPDGTSQTAVNSAFLSVGTNSRMGQVSILGDGALTIKNTAGIITGVLTGSSLMISGSGTATSTYGSQSITLNTQSGFKSGKFNVDSSGNTSASGTLGVFGNSTLGDSDAAGGDTARVYGSLSMGAASTGNAQLYLKASSTTAVPLLIEDNSGNAIGKFASSSVEGIVSGAQVTLQNYSLLALGNANGKAGSLTIRAASSASTGAIVVYRDASAVGAQLSYDSLIVSDSSSTSTLSSYVFTLTQKVNYNQGVFYVDSSGNTSVSGTLSTFGAVTLGDTAGDNINIIGKLQTLNVSNGSTTSTLGRTAFWVNESSGYNLGKFYVDSSGNVSASGTLSLTSSTGGTVSSTAGNLTLSSDANGGIIKLLTGLTNAESMRVGVTDGVQVGVNVAGLKGAGVFNISQTSGNINTSGTMTFTNTSGGVVSSTADALRLVGTATNPAVVPNTSFEFWDKAGNIYGKFLTLSSNSGTSAASTTFTSILPNRTAGNAGFVFNTTEQGGLMASSSVVDRVLVAIQNNGYNQVLVSASGSVYAKSSFIANHTGYGLGDVAEYVNLVTGETGEPGDVLVVDLVNPNQYKKSSSAYSKEIAGVISDTGAFLMGASGVGRAPLSLAGLVKTKVTDENGPIAVGDYLVSASKHGYAMKYDAANPPAGGAGLVGMALEPLAKGEGKITIMVNKGLVAGSNSTAALTVRENGDGQLVQSNDLDMAGKSIFNLLTIKSKDNKWMIDEDGYLIVKITTKQGDKKLYGLQSGQDKELVLSGSSQLENGLKKIELPLIDQEVIDATSTIKVSVTLTGEAKGVFVSEKNYQGFTVKELGGGTSNATFDWMLIAKRRATDYQEPTVAESEPAPIEPSAPVAPEVSSSIPSEETASAPAPIETPVETPPVSPVVVHEESPAPVVEPVVPPVETPPALPAE